MKIFLSLDVLRQPRTLAREMEPVSEQDVGWVAVVEMLRAELAINRIDPTTLSFAKPPVYDASCSAGCKLVTLAPRAAP